MNNKTHLQFIGRTIGLCAIVLGAFFVVFGTAHIASANPTTAPGVGSGVISVSGSNVGIGVVSPQKTLHVANGDQTGARIRIENTNSGAGGRPFDLVAGVNNVVQSGFSIYDASAGTTRLVIDNNGNIGIGNTAPAQKLDVTGNANISGTLTVGVFTPIVAAGNISMGTFGSNTGGGNYTFTGKLNVVSPSYTGESGGMYVAADQANGTVRALYILPPANGGRIFFGDGTTNVYALNMSHVSGIESMPLFSTADGMYWGGNSTPSIYRSANDVNFNSYLTGNYNFNTYNGGSSNATVMKLSTLGRLSLTGSDPTLLTVAGNVSSTGLCLGGVCQTSWSASSQWTTNGTNIYYNTGNVGIGAASPLAKLHINNGTDRDLLIGSDATQLGTAGMFLGSFNDGATAYAPLSIIGSKILLSGGNVGVGTTAPSTKVEIDSNNAPENSNTTPLGGFSIKSTASTALVEGVDSASPFEGWIQVRHGTIAGYTYPLSLQPMGGSVGIGTTNPGYALDVRGTGSFTQPVIVGTPTAGNMAATKSYVDSAASQAVSGGVSGSTSYVPVFTSANTLGNSIIYQSGGNIGIGTTAPGAALEIPGTSAVTGQYIVEILGNTSNGFSGANDANASYLVEQRATSYTVNGGGIVTYPGIRYGLQKEGSWNMSGGGSSIGGAFVVQTSNGGGLGSLPTISEKFRISSAGNVGIGTAAPGYKLDVQGTGNFSQPVIVGTPVAANQAATKSYVDSAVTTGVTGGVSGTAGYHAKFTGTNTVGNSLVYDNGTNVGIGTAAPGYKLDVYNDIAIGGTDALRRDGTYGYLYPWGTGYANNLVKVGGGTTTNMEVTGYLTVDSSGSSFTQPVIVGAPTAGNMAATKSYVDSAVGTVVSTPLLSALGNYVWTAATLPQSYPLGVQTSFVQASQGFPDYGSVITDNTYSGGGGALQLFTPYGPSNGGTGLKVRFGNYDVNSGNSWTSWKTLLASDNFSNYALPLSGGTITGSLTVSGSGSSFAQPVIVGAPTAGNMAATKSYVDSAVNAGGVGSFSSITVSGASTLTGNVTIGTPSNGSGLSFIGGASSAITGLGKITVGTVDPVYQIGTVKYATFGPSMASGVTEEVTGDGTLAKSGSDYEYAINFSKSVRGSDLWVWYQAVDFGKSTVQAIATPYGRFAEIYYTIDGTTLTFHGDAPAQFSFRLTGKRFDWQKWPTQLQDQSEQPGFVLTAK